MSDTDKVFSGSIPKLYETYLVPLIFEPYAADLANRLRSRFLSLIQAHIVTIESRQLER